jgi:hypothetical protein
MTQSMTTPSASPVGYFLFIDESYSPPMPDSGLKIYSLTGILVDVSKYAALRAAHLKLLEPWIRQGEVISAPPILHGSDFLRSESDERKTRVMSDLCRLVIDHNLRVYRSGYFYDLNFQRRGISPLAICFGNLLGYISPIAEHSIVWPVIELDRTSKRQEMYFSTSVRWLDIARHAGLGSSISIPNSQNIGEVLYATKDHSVLANITDLVGYLRGITDLSKHSASMSKFKQDLLAVSRSLEPAIVREDIVTMQWH